MLRVAHDHEEVIAIHAQYRFGPLIYGLAFLLAFWDARVSMLMNLLLALFFAFPPRAVKPLTKSLR